MARDRAGTIERATIVDPRANPPGFELDVVVRGEHLDERIVRYARQKVAAASRVAPAPILLGRLRLTRESHHAHERVIAEVELDVDGHPVRAHAAAFTARVATDRLEQRLRRQLVEAHQRIAFLRRRDTGVAEPGAWRHGDLQTTRPACFPRAPEERRVIRHKSFALGRTTPENAVVEMEMLDHDFHLFVDADTGRDAVVHRTQDGEYRMQRAGDDAPTAGSSPIGLDPQRPPVVTVKEAIARLDTTDEPFLFFVDAETRRGLVLYRRYDGHYGLIEGREAVASLTPTPPRRAGARRRT